MKLPEDRNRAQLYAAIERKAASVERENKRLRAALRYIAHFDDAHMETARTLHYDMRGAAKEALDS